MTQAVFMKVYIGKGDTIAVDKTVVYKKTAKLLKDIIFDCDRYGDRYPNKQVKLDDLLKFHVGWRSCPSSGCVYCFEEDLDKAKEILIQAINNRVQGLWNSFMFNVNQHNKDVANTPGVMTINATVEFKVNE